MATQTRRTVQLGLGTFAGAALDSAAGQRVGAPRARCDPMEDMEPADQIGLDIVVVGEHHRFDFLAARWWSGRGQKGSVS